MKIQLVFDNSGDTLTFESVNDGLVDYYLGCLNASSLNSFHQLSTSESAITRLQTLQSSINFVNELLVKLTGFELDDQELFDQSKLNRLHTVFVLSENVKFDVQANRNHDDEVIASIAEQMHHAISDDESHVITIGDVLSKLGIEHLISNLNHEIHAFESMFSVRYSTEQWVEFPNTFGDSILTSTPTHLYLPFSHLGRTRFNKFLNYDNQFADENNYNELLGFAQINFNRVYSVNMPNEYIKWCNTHDKTPTGEYLNLGILPDIEKNLTRYRQVLYNNVTMNNKFSLYKG
jgi:hypothetical protein